MHLQSSYSFQASMAASFGSSAGCGGGAQLQMLMQQLMSLMQGQLGMGSRGGGRCPAPRGQFGRGGHCGPQRPGLNNFCGGGRGGNNVNINLNGCPSNVNINVGGCPPRHHHHGHHGHHCQGGGMHGQMHGQFGGRCGGRQGQLKQKGKGKPIAYTTRGGYKVSVNKHKVSVKDPNGNEVKHWGDPHENLNGKHLKDWKGKQRTMVLGDGTKITMSADGPKGVTKHTSIYDGGQNVQIKNAKNQIEHHSMNNMDTMMRELMQHDGETAAFHSNHQGDAMYYNMYNEAADGTFTRDFDWLGQASQGGPVHDMYDDPRLKKT